MTDSPDTTILPRRRRRRRPARQDDGHAVHADNLISNISDRLTTIISLARASRLAMLGAAHCPNYGFDGIAQGAICDLLLVDLEHKIHEVEADIDDYHDRGPPDASDDDEARADSAGAPTQTASVD
jgi:hypothetical protein